MWILLGAGAIVFAALNLIWTFRNKSANWFRFMSVSCTALTVCAFYSEEAVRVANGDWAGLMDVMPTMGVAVWVCTIASIAVNSISLFKIKK